MTFLRELSPCEEGEIIRTIFTLLQSDLACPNVCLRSKVECHCLCRLVLPNRFWLVVIAVELKDITSVCVEWSCVCIRKPTIIAKVISQLVAPDDTQINTPYR